jgi:hypothetical protein
VNPVGKDNKGWELIHPLPWYLFSFLYVPENFHRLGPLTDCIGRVARSAEFNIWNSCNTILEDVPMAEIAIQPGDFLVENVIEADRLINRLTSQDWENREDKRFRRNSKAKPCYSGEKKNQDDDHGESNFLLHRFSLFSPLKPVNLNCPYIIIPHSSVGIHRDPAGMLKKSYDGNISLSLN